MLAPEMLFRSNDEKPVFIFYMYFEFWKPETDDLGGS